MKRRSFINKTVAGLLLPFVPVSLTARNALTIPANRESFATLGDKLSNLIQDNRIGTPQHLALTYRYTPGQTSFQAIQTVARHHIDLAGQIVGSTLDLPDHRLFADSSTTPFGTYSAQMEQDGLVIVWQYLARLNGQPRPAAGTFILSGSTGILRLYLPDYSYEITDFQTRTTQPASQPAS